MTSTTNEDTRPPHGPLVPEGRAVDLRSLDEESLSRPGLIVTDVPLRTVGKPSETSLASGGGVPAKKPGVDIRETSILYPSDDEIDETSENNAKLGKHPLRKIVKKTKDSLLSEAVVDEMLEMMGENDGLTEKIKDLKEELAEKTKKIEETLARAVVDDPVEDEKPDNTTKKAPYFDYKKTWYTWSKVRRLAWEHGWLGLLLTALIHIGVVTVAVITVLVAREWVPRYQPVLAVALKKHYGILPYFGLAEVPCEQPGWPLYYLFACTDNPVYAIYPWYFIGAVVALSWLTYLVAVFRSLTIEYRVRKNVVSVIKLTRIDSDDERQESMAMKDAERFDRIGTWKKSWEWKRSPMLDKQRVTFAKFGNVVWDNILSFLGYVDRGLGKPIRVPISIERFVQLASAKVMRMTAAVGEVPRTRIETAYAQHQTTAGKRDLTVTRREDMNTIDCLVSLYESELAAHRLIHENQVLARDDPK